MQVVQIHGMTVCVAHLRLKTARCTPNNISSRRDERSLDLALCKHSGKVHPYIGHQQAQRSLSCLAAARHPIKSNRIPSSEHLHMLPKPCSWLSADVNIASPATQAQVMAFPNTMVKWSLLPPCEMLAGQCMPVWCIRCSCLRRRASCVGPKHEGISALEGIVRFDTSCSAAACQPTARARA